MNNKLKSAYNAAREYLSKNLWRNLQIIFLSVLIAANAGDIISAINLILVFWVIDKLAKEERESE